MTKIKLWNSCLRSMCCLSDLVWHETLLWYEHNYNIKLIKCFESLRFHVTLKVHWLKSLSTVSMFYHLSYLILCKDAIHTFFTCAFRNVIYKIVTRNNYSGILLNRIWSNISLRLQICGFHLTFKSQNLRSHTFFSTQLDLFLSTSGKQIYNSL